MMSRYPTLKQSCHLSFVMASSISLSHVYQINTVNYQKECLKDEMSCYYHHPLNLPKFDVKEEIVLISIMKCMVFV